MDAVDPQTFADKILRSHINKYQEAKEFKKIPSNTKRKSWAIQTEYLVYHAWFSTKQQLSPFIW